MTSKQSDVTFQEITDYIMAYMRERDWDTQPARGLAICIALESNELLEHYQWKETPTGNKAEIAEELADILIYVFTFAAQHAIDIPAEIKKKLEKSAKKYPAAQFKGKSPTAKEKARIQAKLKHKKVGL